MYSEEAHTNGSASVSCFCTVLWQMRRSSRNEVVTALMKFVRREKRPYHLRMRDKVAERVFLRYGCHRPGCSNPDVLFLGKTWFGSSYKHLRDCYPREKSIAEQENILSL